MYYVTGGFFMSFSTIWAGIKQRLYGEAIVLDEAGNVLLGTDPTIPAAGNPHYTISQRLAEMRERGSKVGCIGCKILTWIQNKIFRISGDHCTAALSGVQEDMPTGG